PRRGGGAPAAAPRAARSSEAPRAGYVAPAGAVERELAALWEDLRGQGEVGAEDDFFDLGGHSLIAVRLFARIRHAFEVDLPISVLFEAPTIASCAALIRAARGDAGEVEAPRFTHLVPMHAGDP